MIVIVTAADVEQNQKQKSVRLAFQISLLARKFGTQEPAAAGDSVRESRASALLRSALELRSEPRKAGRVRPYALSTPCHPLFSHHA